MQMFPYIEEAKLVVQSIGTLASLIKIWQTAKSRGEDVTAEQVNRIVSAPQPSLPEISLRRIAQVIPGPILDAIRDMIRDAIERFREALSDPTNTSQEKDKEEKIARITVCRELKRIKGLNNGVLPDGVLEDYWASFGCQ
jgi:hypothetical protein